MAEMNEEILELLNCPVCFDTIFPPIFQCPNGHTICARCKLTINNTCPICRSEMGGDIRALTLEKMVAPMRLHCQYRTTGCNEVIRYDSKAKHEETCRFRPYNCPHPCGDGTTTPCGVKGDIPSLMAHMRNVHGSTLEVSYIINSLCRHVDPYSGTPYSSNLSMYEYMGDHFCLNFEAFFSPQDLVYMVFLTFLGEDFDANNYRYSLEIGNETRKMIWVGVPRSIRQTKEQIRQSSDGLIIHQNVVQNFSESNSVEELTLRVKGFIWKDGLGVESLQFMILVASGISTIHQDDEISRQFNLHI